MSGSQTQGVGGGKPPVSAGKKVLIALAVIVVLFILYWLGGGVIPSKTVETGDASTPAGITRPIALPPQEPRREPPPDVTQAAVALPPQQAQQRRAQQAQQHRQPLKAAPIMAFEETAPPAATQARASQHEAGGTGEGELTARLTASQTPPARARRLRNPLMTITQGTMIPCVRETPINTQLPGFVRCLVDAEVTGQQGNVTLIDRGARIVGQIQNGVSHGQNRAFILWTRLENPDGVVVELGSPGTNALGENGIQLDVQTNFLSRFGGAIMLSFIDSGLQAAALAASAALSGRGNSQGVNFFQIQSGGRQAAAHALDATVNIPPFGTSPQGMPEAVFVARDIDFSSVYEIRTVR